MKIAVNTRLLIKDKLDGIGWFTYETLKRIVTSHPEVKFYFLFDRPYSQEFIFSDNIEPVVLRPQARHPVLFYIWFEYSVRKFLDKVKPDLFLSPDGYLSLSTKTRSLAVIHDINFLHRPKDLPFLVRCYYNYFFPRFAQKAERIATVSNYSKNDISAHYHINPEKIDVVYNGANEIYEPISEEKQKLTKQKYTSGSDYFIFVGALHPRKNVHSLIRAFDEFKKITDSKLKLLIVGDKMFLTGEIQQAINESSFSDNIIFTGRLEPDELKMVMASAFALVFIPFYEGFGIPLLEAMNCDVPVIASNVTSLPEVAGAAAIYADPGSVSAIRRAMERIFFDEQFRNKLIREGRKQRVLFSWENTANSLWKSIEKSIN
jgi:glycosyltransferase involved in cell wall biosynthesis